MRAPGRWPACVPGSVLSRVTRAVTLTTESRGRAARGGALVRPEPALRPTAASYSGSHYAAGLAAHGASVLRVTVVAQVTNAALLLSIIPFISNPGAVAAVAGLGSGGGLPACGVQRGQPVRADGTAPQATPTRGARADSGARDTG